MIDRLLSSKEQQEASAWCLRVDPNEAGDVMDMVRAAVSEAQAKQTLKAVAEFIKKNCGCAHCGDYFGDNMLEAFEKGVWPQ